MPPAPPEPLAEAVARLRARVPEPPYAAIVLGSGLGGEAVASRALRRVPLADLPGIPTPRVAGHGAALSLLEIAGRPALVQEGRVHLYEGYEAREVAATVRLFAALGVRRLVLTCASGSVNPDIAPGMLVGVRDHLNLTGANPLGPGAFVPMANAYRADLYPKELPAAVLAALRGPSYETAAETEMLRRLGADIVSMSTVPEAIAARAEGMEIAAFSAVTNRAGGADGAPESHERVIARAAGMRKLLWEVVEATLAGWAATLRSA